MTRFALLPDAPPCFVTWNLLHARLNSHYKAQSYKKKQQKKIKTQEISLERTSSQQVSVNSTHKAIQIVGQRKAFYWQRIPKPSCVRKETVDIDVLVTSRSGDRRVMQSIRILSLFGIVWEEKRIFNRGAFLTNIFNQTFFTLWFDLRNHIAAGPQVRIQLFNIGDMFSSLQTSSTALASPYTKFLNKSWNQDGS